MNFAWLFLGGGALFLFGVVSWRGAVFGALWLAVCEGAIRKWVLPQESPMVYFAKDFLLLGAYIGYFFGEGKRQPVRFGEGLNFLLVFSVAWTFFQSFNPGTGSLTAGLFGWRAYVLYIPLCFMVPALFRSTDELDRFLRYYIALALPVTLLGVAQFSAPTDSPLNVYALGASDSGEEEVIAVFGEDQFVRVTGTFSYISGYAAYLIVTLGLLLPILASSRTIMWRFVFGCTLALIIGNVIMTGSRAPVLGAAIVLGGFAFLTPLTGKPGERKSAWIHWGAGAAGILAAVYLFQDAFTALEERTTNSWDEGKTRFWAAVVEPWEYLETAGFLGHGNGITQPAVSALRTALHLPSAHFTYSSPTDAENSRVLMELGILGFFLWYAMRVGLLVALWRTRRGLTTPFLRQLALGAFLVLFYQFFTTTMFVHTANLYHWFLASFIFLLPKLDAQAQAQRFLNYSETFPQPSWLHPTTTRTGTLSPPMHGKSRVEP